MSFYTDFRDQLNAHRYPMWASLARDYLPIMASSVSSERAFLATGITISKRRNQLKGDIVEALECLKCMFHSDIIFRNVPTSEEVEVELDSMEIFDKDKDFVEAVEEAERFSWDQLLADGDEDGDEDEGV